MSKYVVSTRDVDGSTRKRYASFKGARKRFEEMLGYSMENAIAEYFYQWAEQGRELPAPEGVKRLSGVSMFGTVVEFEKLEEEIAE